MREDLQAFSITEEQWQAIRSKFAADGVEVPDDSTGEINKSGIRASFTWDGKALRVTVTDKPFIYPIRVVIERLTDYINEAIA